MKSVREAHDYVREIIEDEGGCSPVYLVLFSGESF